MVQRAMQFTPEVLLSAPRRSAGVPNPSGTQALYTSSTYDFKVHKKSSETRLLDIKTGESHVILPNVEVSDFNWISDQVFVCLQSAEDGTTNILVADAGHVLSAASSGHHYAAGTINAAAGNLKVKSLDAEGQQIAVVVSAPAAADGSLFTPDQAKRKTRAGGRLYNNLFVRHWDKWVTSERPSLWYGQLTADSNAKYTLSEVKNALKSRPGLACPIEPFGGSDCFDIRTSGLIFVSKDPSLNPALSVKCNVYLAQIDSWTQTHAPTIEEIPITGFEGAASSPVFDPTGTKAAFLMMLEPGYEADQNRIFILTDVNVSSTRQQKPIDPVCITARSNGNDPFWNRSPSSISFSADGNSLFAVAEDRGYAKLFKFDIDFNQPEAPQARILIEQGHVNEVKPLADGKVFVLGNSLIDNSWYAIVDNSPPNTATPKLLWTHSNSATGSKFGLHPSQVSSIWTPANNPTINKSIHSWVIKPSFFNPSNTYPVAYLIHGGPQGSWTDAWSTRWNPAVFAEQGFIVIAPNPTGSTGYGQAFTDAIRYNWGGDPYEDIVKCFEWAEKNMPEADHSRAVALGASYGGYMMNWIQGHPLGRKFRALVCHDGVFSFTSGQLTTDELYFPFHDLGYPSWLPPKRHTPDYSSSSAPSSSTADPWTANDPSNYLSEWKTPMLIIHSEKDYRLPIGEGLAAFNVLQARGIESQFLVFDEENHWVLKPENSLVWHKVVLNWIRKFVGMKPFTDEDPEGEEFWGGVEEKEEGGKEEGEGKERE